MDVKLRKIIYKNQPLTNMGRKVIVYNNNIYYFIRNIIKHDSEKLRALYNSKNGNICYIVGNGPSLTIEDLELIKNKDCFAANLIFRLYDKTKWRPTYYFIQDRYADTGNYVDEMEVPYLFIGEYYWRKRGMKNQNAICTHTLISRDTEDIDFSTDISKGIVNHWTVTYSMIQTAVYMGYKTIYLLGMDHNYSLTFDENGNIVENENTVSHFFEDKNPKEVIANIEAMNKAYISARKYADSHGIKIYNVTRGGKLEWFERKTLEESLKEG